MTRARPSRAAPGSTSLQVSMVACFWFVLEELDALAGDRRLWFSRR